MNRISTVARRVGRADQGDSFTGTAKLLLAAFCEADRNGYDYAVMSMVDEVSALLDAPDDRTPFPKSISWNHGRASTRRWSWSSPPLMRRAGSSGPAAAAPPTARSPR